MMMLLKGLSLVISGTKPIYLQRHARVLDNFAGLTDRLLHPVAADSKCGTHPVSVAIAASIVLNKTLLGPLHLRARQQ